MITMQFDPPLVAILRGLQPEDAVAVGTCLFEAGFRLLEVPLNRSGAIEAIRVLTNIAPSDALVGGGTMLSRADVDAVYAAGGRMFIARNCDREVIAHAVDRGMLAVPGVATPTEALAPLAAGAHALKIFPAEVIGLAGLKAIRTILPPATKLWPVGGVTPELLASWTEAGAAGFGIGSNLYTPGLEIAVIGQRARNFVSAWHAIQKR